MKDEEIECVVKATIGYHPSEACFEKITKENLDEKILALRKLYENNKEHIVAIGECGIDTHYE
ncbi:TatD family hydrolase [Patescibacteria group bacterium]|nr:TatD family hydrolase [Patescibacteria group bacterium]